MSNRVGKIVFAFVLSAVMSLSATSCRHYDVDAILLERDDVSLTIKGSLCLAYDPLTCQLGYNDSRNEFRVYDDLIGNMFLISCNKNPDTEGMYLSANLTYTTSSSTKTLNGLDFCVRKLDPDGKIWLWNDSKKVGVVIQRL